MISPKTKQTIMEWYLKALRQYADFEGRARRKEYWMFTLFNLIFAILAVVIDGLIGTGAIIYLFYVLGTLIPNLSVSVRRLHDVGKSGWMYLVALIPLVGFIWLLVLFTTDSQPGDNEYGPNPKEENSGDYFGSAETLD
jgi:uncharacterized membrane protein YhaH (DUF805 family)